MFYQPSLVFDARLCGCITADLVIAWGPGKRQNLMLEVLNDHHGRGLAQLLELSGGLEFLVVPPIPKLRLDQTRLARSDRLRSLQQGLYLYILLFFILDLGNW